MNPPDPIHPITCPVFVVDYGNVCPVLFSLLFSDEPTKKETYTSKRIESGDKEDVNVTEGHQNTLKSLVFKENRTTMLVVY